MNSPKLEIGQSARLVVAPYVERLTRIANARYQLDLHHGGRAIFGLVQRGGTFETTDISLDGMADETEVEDAVKAAIRRHLL
jgi:hypothetical protein